MKYSEWTREDLYIRVKSLEAELESMTWERDAAQDRVERWLDAYKNDPAKLGKMIEGYESVRQHGLR